MRLPARIDPSPIVESLIEIRFEPAVPEDAVFGILLIALKEQFKNPSDMPAKSLSGAIRRANPMTRYLATHRLEGDTLVALVGPEVFAVGLKKPPYPGWTKLSEGLQHALSTVLKSNVIRVVTRIGLRYVNFFPEDIFSHLRVSFRIDDKPLRGKNTYFKTEMTEEGHNVILQLATDAKLPIDPATSGTIIDIDIHREGGLKDVTNVAEYFEFTNSAHMKAKRLFFSLLNESFLKQKLNPTYD